MPQEKANLISCTSKLMAVLKSAVLQGENIKKFENFTTSDQFQKLNHIERQKLNLPESYISSILPTRGNPSPEINTVSPTSNASEFHTKFLERSMWIRRKVFLISLIF